ncbi:hypothetical protein KB557_08325 [Synechococcus sp. Cruz CV12-2-Slac-r]|uniref:hypothetical protein n=1 Tax=Synechococcus lacustris TaxID=2116544 RepID=UPI00137972F1|nr:hypothetical protein [Synechococcus lacustris]MCP9940242.1 hypothetical protein [Synechococcus sp. Cruz CV12-2-Slac-r]
MAKQRSILLERYTFEQDRPKPFLPALKEDAPWLQTGCLAPVGFWCGLINKYP